MLLPRPVSEAEGPYDAGYLPRLEMTFHAVEEPITEPVAKLGGDPVWLDEPCWPVHPGTREPLDFIGQFPVPTEPGEERRMAYLFLSYNDYETGGMDPEDGEAVMLVQPGGRIPAFAIIGPAGTKGRSLWRFGPDEEQVPVQFRIDMTAVPEKVERELEEHGTVDVRDYVGGKPSYPDWAGVEAPWRFFFRLGGMESDGPYFLNFAYGAGFAYLSPDRLEGRFSWEAA
ncbi:hypothetical protein QMZ92_34445 [Streptomyces sp. HNM0645]|uniref:hypothetical protein n=1 Tax=Streptomyces sp. HNM0645 TaxID=2782343 RepID=UPI0024B86E77|nr:hypothetical protein [Streptomyces sp. HNM0645]MDI9889288.1 hypothetical protein [Streptomyces sp. HNM0645]